MAFLLDLIPMERARKWYLLPPDSISFSPESVIVIWTEDALANPIQPLMFIMSFNCCGGVTEFGTGNHAMYTLQVYVKKKGKWTLRNSATALIPQDLYKVANQELCEDSPLPTPCPIDVSPGLITPIDLESQIDDWIANSSIINGMKQDFIPFSLDFFGCDPLPTPCIQGPGWYSTLLIRGDDFLFPLKVSEVLCQPDEHLLYNLVFDEHELLIIDWIQQGITVLQGGNYTIIDRYDGIFLLQWDALDLITEVRLTFCEGDCSQEQFSCDNRDEGWYTFHPSINGIPLNWPPGTLSFPNSAGTDGSDPDDVFITYQGNFDASYWAWDNDPTFVGSTFQEFNVNSGLVVAQWPPHGEFSFEFLYCGGTNVEPPVDWVDELPLPDSWVCTIRLGVRELTGYQDIFTLQFGEPCSESCFFDFGDNIQFPPSEVLLGIVGQFNSESPSREVEIIGWDLNRVDVPEESTDYLCTPSGNGCPRYSERFGAFSFETLTTISFRVNGRTSSINIGVAQNGLEFIYVTPEPATYSYSLPQQLFLRYTFRDRASGREFSRDVPLDIPWSDFQDQPLPPPGGQECCDYLITPRVTISLNLPARRIRDGAIIPIPMTFDLVALPPVNLQCQPDVPTPVIEAAAFVAGNGASFVLDTAFDATLSFFFPLSGTLISRIVDLGVEFDVDKSC